MKPSDFMPEPGIIHDAADGGTSEEYCSWTMANRAAEAIHARLLTVKANR